MSNSLKRANRSIKREADNDDDDDDASIDEASLKHSRRSPHKVSSFLLS